MQHLVTSDRRALLALARAAVERATCGDCAPDVDGEALTSGLAEMAAAFVTLHECGELRGCIGFLRFDVPLWINVRDAAVAAALHDPRFPPVRISELGALEIEVSVLEPPVALADPSLFEAGRHGIVVEKGMHRGLLLPQVAIEMRWNSEQMLDAVCRKAGLPEASWREAGTRLFAFESICFSERGLARSVDGSARA